MGKLERLICTLLTLIIFSSVLPLVGLVSATQTAKISLDPPSIIDLSLQPGETFVINASVFDVVDLYCWQVKIHFDSSILTCVDAWLPSGHVFEGKMFMPTPPDFRESSVFVGATLLGAGPGFEGDGLLVSFLFNVTGVGECDLTQDRSLTLMEDTWANRIDVVLEDGYFSNRLPPPPAFVYVDPERIVNPELNMCTQFPVNVSIINATDLYSLEFKLSFNPEILNVSDVQLGDFFPGTITPDIEINNTIGFVSFNASLYPLEMVLEGNGTLATVTFHVRGSGSSDLTLYDTNLRDPTGETLSHTTSDGYFSNEVLTADLNGDGVVDIRDISEIARAYGSYLGHSRWDASLDLYRDGTIDLRDIVFVAMNFGETY